MTEDVKIDLRLAEPSDASLLAEAAVAAGGGIYEHLLEQAAQGFTPAAAIAAALAQDGEGFAWRNAIVAESAGQALGAAIAYPGAAYRLPPVIAAAAGAEAKRDLAPLFESRPPEDSYYLHAIWTRPAARGRGVGKLLLAGVIGIGGQQGYSRTSLHVWRDNATAISLYKSNRFTVLERLDVPRRPLLAHDGGKLLMATA